MNEEKPINADDLTKTKKPGDVQLTEEELSKASGGDFYKIHMEQDIKIKVQN